jgi:hypothetical protein
MSKIVIFITEEKAGFRLEGKNVPADATDPVMVATYKTLADAIDQSEWMTGTGAYASRRDSGECLGDYEIHLPQAKGTAQHTPERIRFLRRELAQFERQAAFNRTHYSEAEAACWDTLADDARAAIAKATQPPTGEQT